MTINNVCRCTKVMASLFPLVLCFLMIMGNVNKGIDITDEGYYIGWATHAVNSYGTVSQFGHYTGVLWELCNHNLAVFRGVGILILMLIASLLMRTVEEYFRSILNYTFSLSQKFLNFAIVNCSVFTYYYLWLLTPSYNWLSLVSCLIFLIGLLRLNIDKQPCNLLSNDKVIIKTYRSTLVIGFSFMLSFMAKPTTALILGGVTLAWVSFTSLRKNWFNINVQISAFTLLFFLMHILLFENGVFDFIRQLSLGLEYGTALRPKNESVQLFSKAFQDLSSIPLKISETIWGALIFLVVIAVLNVCVAIIYRSKPSWLKYANLILLIVITFSLWIQLWSNGYWQGGKYGYQNGFAGFAFSFTLILSVCFTKLPHLKQLDKITYLIKPFVFILTLTLLPFAYAFGSGIPLIKQSTGAYFFFALAAYLAALWFDDTKRYKWLTYLVAISIFFNCLNIVYGAMQKPYRLLGNLNHQTSNVSFIGSNTKLLVDPITAKYITKLQRLAIKNGWQEGGDVIDMTGGTPLISFILNAVPLGKVWLLGRYQGSADVAYKALGKVKLEQLRRAWVLTAPNGRREIPLSVFDKLGLEFNANFEKVGEVTSGHRNELQILWRPKNTSKNAL